MRPYVVLKYVGVVLLIDALFLLIAAAVSAAHGDDGTRPLLYSSLVTALFGVFPLIFVPPTAHITNNEGLMIVVSSWLLSCLVGTLPYILWGGEFSFTNAWFESVSGFTTTGSSILTEIEDLPLGLLFWRAATHWIGGMGIIMFVLSVLPSMGIAGAVLYRAEMSPLAQTNFRETARITLRILLTVYAGLTLLETIALRLCGMSLFDALTHSFATIATGGFSTRGNSIAYYNSVPIELVIIIFMVLSGVHFGLLFSVVFRRSSRIWRSTVVRYYLLALAVGVGIATSSLQATGMNPAEALRYSAFQIVSIGTSTGFANADSAVWPPLIQLLLIFFALQCACVGSTSGGIKVDRVVMFGKATARQLRLLRHPKAISPVRLNGDTVEEQILAMAVLYIGVYLAVVFAASFLLTAIGVDALAAFSGVVATTGNVGPGLGSVGSMSSYAHIPSLGKWILTGTMLAGRLEIYGLMLFFLPATWKGKRQ
jgi:trk system potassium uptake protein TrkH